MRNGVASRALYLFLQPAAGDRHRPAADLLHIGAVVIMNRSLFCISGLALCAILVAVSTSAMAQNLVFDPHVTIAASDESRGWTLYNPGTSAAVDVTATIRFEPGAMVDTRTPFASVDANAVTWDVGDLGPGQSVTLAVTGENLVATDAAVHGRVSGLPTTHTSRAVVAYPAESEWAEWLAATPAHPEVAAVVARFAADGDLTAEALTQYVRDEVDYDPYRGALRGPVGTLWGQAGNAWDNRTSWSSCCGRPVSPRASLPPR